MRQSDKEHLTLEVNHIHNLLNLGWCQDAIAQTEVNANGWFIVHMPTEQGTDQDLLLRQGHSTYGEAMGWRDRSESVLQTWMIGPDEQGKLCAYYQVEQTVKCFTSEHEELWGLILNQFHHIYTRLCQLDHIQKSARERAQAVCAGQVPADITLPHAVWGAWLQALRAMEQTAKQRGWALEPLGLLPPRLDEALLTRCDTLETDQALLPWGL